MLLTTATHKTTRKPFGAWALAVAWLLLAATAAAQDTPPRADWPQFRGAARDAKAPAAEAALLARTWPAEGPRVLWSVDLLGVGYSAPAVRAGKVFVNDYDPKMSQWMLRCLDLADGRELWRWGYANRIRNSHGMTRTIPAVSDAMAYSLDPKGRLHAVDVATGQQAWEVNLPAAYKALPPPWYNGQCPLLDEGRVVLGVGGSVLMAAFKPDGTTAWTTPNEAKHRMSHSSVMPVEIDGVRQYLWCTLKGLVGVAAEDGRLLWSYDAWTPQVACAPSALDCGGGRIFMSAGYKAGSVMVQVARDGEGRWRASELFTKADVEFNTDTQTAIRLDDDTILAVDLYDAAGRLTAMSMTGEVLWRREDVSFGLGNYILAGDILLAMDGDSGTLRMMQVGREGWKELAAAAVAPGHEVWGPMVLVEGRLLVRNLEKLYCLDLRSGGETP